MEWYYDSTIPYARYWNWVSAQGSEETRMMLLPDGRKSFKVGLAVLIQYRRVTDIQPASHVAVASTRYAYLRRAVKIQFTSPHKAEIW